MRGFDWPPAGASRGGGPIRGGARERWPGARPGGSGRKALPVTHPGTTVLAVSLQPYRHLIDKH
jgi:hypothetical protein